MSSKTFHMSVDIMGFLAHYKKKSMSGMMLSDDGKLLSDREARAEIQKALSKGHKLLPTHKCEGFDPFEKGCPGHETTEED